MTEDERRVVVLTLLARREYGSASEELVIARAGLGRVEGYGILASLERQGLLERDPAEGVRVTFSGRMFAGL